MSIIAYLSRVSYMYEIIPYLQAPSDEGETARKADYSALQSETDAKVIHWAQYNGLPRVYQNEIEDRRVKWRTLTDSDWHDELLVSIKRKEQRDLQEEKAKKRKSAKGVKTSGGQGGSKQPKTSEKKGKGGEIGRAHV